MLACQESIPSEPFAALPVNPAGILLCTDWSFQIGKSNGAYLATEPVSYPGLLCIFNVHIKDLIFLKSSPSLPTCLHYAVTRMHLSLSKIGTCPKTYKHDKVGVTAPSDGYQPWYWGWEGKRAGGGD